MKRRASPPRTRRVHPFALEVSAFVRRHRLFADGDRVLVAVSGGPDSTALLLALAEAADGPGPRARLVVAHYDHGLRRGSAGDARFVKALAKSLGLPFRGGKARRLARKDGGSVEAAAREARYAFLARTARRMGARAVAVGHHRDDRVETVLHRALQGGNLRGLAGIPLRRPLEPEVEVVRPLYEQDRAAVLAYLRAKKARWRTDPTNADGSNARSRLRRTVLPAILRAYPYALTALLGLERAAREADLAVEREARRVLRGARRVRGPAFAVPRKALAGRGEEVVRRVLEAALSSLGAESTAPPRAAVERLCAAIAAGDGRARRVPIRAGFEAVVDAVQVSVRRQRGPIP